MGVATQLQVHASLLCLFKMIGLMVEEYDILFLVDPMHQLVHGLAVAIAAIVTAHYGDATDAHGVVTQDADTRRVKQVEGLSQPSDIFVVA